MGNDISDGMSHAEQTKDANAGDSGASLCSALSQILTESAKGHEARCLHCGEVNLIADQLCDTLGWMPPESAPSNGTLIIGDFGWPWPIPCVWDPYDEMWCVATIQASPMVDGADNYWFEIDTESKHCLRRWMHMPVLPNVSRQVSRSDGGADAQASDVTESRD